jgi:uncharacterized membrane protein YcjF (UPF0283 family)
MVATTLKLATALGGVIAIGAPLAAHAQSGDALANAESACFDQGIRPHTSSYDICVDRVATMFDRGAIDLGYIQARSVRSARDVCASYGISPGTLNYRECLNTEIDRRAGRTYDIHYSLLADRPHDSP